MTFEQWWLEFISEHPEWQYADSAALRKAAFNAGAASRDAEVAELKAWNSEMVKHQDNLADMCDQLRDELSVARMQNTVVYGTSHPEIYKTNEDKLREQVKLLRDALLTCSVGDFSTGHVIYPSFDEKLVEEALAATALK